MLGRDGGEHAGNEHEGRQQVYTARRTPLRPEEDVHQKDDGDADRADRGEKVAPGSENETDRDQEAERTDHERDLRRWAHVHLARVSHNGGGILS